MTGIYYLILSRIKSAFPLEDMEPKSVLEDSPTIRMLPSEFSRRSKPKSSPEPPKDFSQSNSPDEDNLMIHMS